MEEVQTPIGATPGAPSLLDDFDPAVIERAVLNDSEEGRRIAASFVKVFGEFVTASVRPVLIEVADAAGEPQLLVNGLAELLRSTAERIEFPLDHPRAGSPSLKNAESSDQDEGTEEGQ